MGLPLCGKDSRQICCNRDRACAGFVKLTQRNQRSLRRTEGFMEGKEFANYRKKLGKTQRQMAQLIGTSIKAVHSYEQGWRSVPAHVERQVLFLLSRLPENRAKQTNCWTLIKCPPERRRECPAYEFKTGNLCWFINGTLCSGKAHKNWKEKMEMCRACKIMQKIL